MTQMSLCQLHLCTLSLVQWSRLAVAIIMLIRMLSSSPAMIIKSGDGHSIRVVRWNSPCNVPTMFLMLFLNIYLLFKGLCSVMVLVKVRVKARMLCYLLTGHYNEILFQITT